MIILFHKNS